MKTKIFGVLLLLIVGGTISAQSTFDKWQAIKEFHTVISQTFHPAEQGNLEPIKSRSEELSIKAAALLTSDIPAEYRTKEILATIEKLKAKSSILQKIVAAKAPDAEITGALTEVHEIFHEIVGLCSEEKKP